MWSRGWVIWLVVAAVWTGAAQGRDFSPIPTRFSQTIDIPPRRQWNANDGYCGETSFISAGLYFGQYCSQFTARSLASPGVAQSSSLSQLLLGTNDVEAARRMRLEAVPFYSHTQRNTEEFFAWLESAFMRGHVVILGVFNNTRALDEDDRGSSIYDHIVPMLELGSRVRLDGEVRRSRPSDVITFSDNGLYGPIGDPPRRPMLYSYRLRTFPRTRSEANAPRGPIYSLRPSPENFAVAITGIVDLDGVTIPVRLTSSLDGEPEMINGSDTPPVPAPLTLTATVTIPDQTVAYTLYRYDDFAKVPAAGFNASADRAVQTWDIPAGSGPTFVTEIQTMSAATVVLRAVPQSAP
jgi:hypothetical protein